MPAELKRKKCDDCGATFVTHLSRKTQCDDCIEYDRRTTIAGDDGVPFIPPREGFSPPTEWRPPSSHREGPIDDGALA